MKAETSHANYPCFFFAVSFSGGVMIYFDRIEVVNYLIPSAGKIHSGFISIIV